MRRVNPALSARNWIVVPFTNATRTPDIAWLRDATVNLLTLNDGLSIARRAGADKLVMGDYFKVGKGTRFIINVFDVRRGSRLPSFTQKAPDQDSLLSAFGPMARTVLALRPPARARAIVDGFA